MKQLRWHLCLAVFVLVFLALALPGTAAAAPDGSVALRPASGSILVDQPTQPTFAVPGIFVLKFGEKAGTAELDLPPLNTVGSVTGLTISPSVNWDTMTISQKQPAILAGVATITEGKVTVQGANQGYNSEGSVMLKADNPSFKAAGKLGFRYEAVSQRGGFTLQNASVAVAAGPAQLSFAGMNSTDGGLTIDSMKLDVPAANASMTMSGYKVQNGRAEWKAISVANAPNTALQFGNVASISEMQLAVAGPANNYTTVGSARLKVNGGQAAQADAQLYFVHDPTKRQTGVALGKGNMGFQIPGWNVRVEGINSVEGGVKVDTISLASEPLSLTAEVTGVVASTTTGLSFEQAKVTYAPGGQSGGFEAMIQRTNAGYVLTTTTVLSAVASGK
ncbi:MAG: hypothetical protein ACPL7M_08495 [Bryobacteraceae bacterium]